MRERARIMEGGRASDEVFGDFRGMVVGREIRADNSEKIRNA
jgi:hypothetical protein